MNRLRWLIVFISLLVLVLLVFKLGSNLINGLLLLSSFVFISDMIFNINKIIH